MHLLESRVKQLSLLSSLVFGYTFLGSGWVLNLCTNNTKEHFLLLFWMIHLSEWTEHVHSSKKQNVRVVFIPTTFFFEWATLRSVLLQASSLVFGYWVSVLSGHFRRFRGCVMHKQHKRTCFIAVNLCMLWNLSEWTQHVTCRNEHNTYILRVCGMYVLCSFRQQFFPRGRLWGPCSMQVSSG